MMLECELLRQYKMILLAGQVLSIACCSDVVELLGCTADKCNESEIYSHVQ